MKNSIFVLLLMVALASCKKEEVQPEATTPEHPIAFELESIKLIGFDETDYAGNYWDSSTNPPDPLVELSKSGAVVYVSDPIANAAHNATYSLNTGHIGELPVRFSDGEEFYMELLDNDGTTSDYMGAILINDPLKFFYDDDYAALFEDVTVATSNSSVQLQLSGRFIYN